MLNRVFAGAAVLLGGSVFLQEQPTLPTVSVNHDEALLSYWPSEEIGSSDPPECAFWQLNETYDSSMCGHFTCNRLGGAPQRARTRAMRCAAQAGVECVLSSEVGLAAPVAFLNHHSSGEMRVVLAPKLVPLPSEQQHVRVPSLHDGLFAHTRTFLMNRTIQVEFFDGVSKAMYSEIFAGSDAFCVQLLRESYEPACWEVLDS